LEKPNLWNGDMAQEVCNGLVLKFFRKLLRAGHPK